MLLVGRRRVRPGRPGVPAQDLIRPCPTFLVEQTDRYTPNFRDDPPCMTEIIVTCDAWLADAGARIVFGGARGWYNARHDGIHLPDRGSFRDSRASSHVEAFYATAFRGLGHWATARGRSHRDLAARYGDTAPAAGHLVAELFAAFACARFGIRNAPRPDLARHADSWRDLLTHDRRALYEIAAMASAALRTVGRLQLLVRDQDRELHLPTVRHRAATNLGRFASPAASQGHRVG
jgi:antirestriction protein ArdC